jgi:hypothetical protein
MTMTDRFIATIPLWGILMAMILLCAYLEIVAWWRERCRSRDSTDMTNISMLDEDDSV